MGSLAVTAYARPYQVRDVEAFLEMHLDMSARYPHMARLAVIDTTSWGSKEIKQLRDQPTRDALQRLQSALTGSSVTAVACLGTGFAAAFTRSLAIGFGFITRSQKTSYFGNLEPSLLWMNELCVGFADMPSLDEMRKLMTRWHHAR